MIFQFFICRAGTWNSMSLSRVPPPGAPTSYISTRKRRKRLTIQPPQLQISACPAESPRTCPFFHRLDRRSVKKAMVDPN